MSAKYTFLAWDTPVKNSGVKVALLQLANNADDDGFSYYSISKMAKACGMSDRNFIRQIAELEKAGVLSVERRPNRPSLYTLVGDEMGVTLCHLQMPEVTECHAEVTECHLVPDKMSHDPIITPDTPPESIIPIDSFTKFWELYGKKVGKPNSEKAWHRIMCRSNGHEVVKKILEAVLIYTKSKPDKQFRKDPERWLKYECWNDEVITSHDSTTDLLQMSADSNWEEGINDIF